MNTPETPESTPAPQETPAVPDAVESSLPDSTPAPVSAAADPTPVEPTPSADVVPETEAPTASTRPTVVLPALPPQPVPEVPPSPQQQDLSRIAQDFQIRKMHVEAVVQLLDSGNTVPFITRYRKEMTGGLDEELIRRIQTRVASLRSLADRKQTILKSIAGQGRLTDDLTRAILESDHPKRLEDLYLPYKPKKRSLATEAREKGLDKLAEAIWTRDPIVEKLDEMFAGLVDPDKQLATAEDVAKGVGHILAEMISEHADVRGAMRAYFRDTAVMTTTKLDSVAEAKAGEYRDYHDFKEQIRKMPPHRILAINRGEHEKVIKVQLVVDPIRARHIVADIIGLPEHPHREYLTTVLEDAADRLLLPGIEREIRREMTEFAQDHAVDIFAKNLRSLLLRAPLGGKRILAVDPAIRSGCKLAILDETGSLVEHGVVYPHPPQNQVEPAKRKIEQLIRKYQISIIAIGNGTGCRETEELVSSLLAELEQRRINPQPTVATEPPVTAAPDSAPIAVTPPTIEDLPATSTEATTLTQPMFGAAETVVPTLQPGLEASEPSLTSVTLSTETPPAVVTPPIPAPPPAPEIDLTGLPEAPADIAYVVVNEAGASDYSASAVAKEEFPDLDATVRGTVSIGRRLQDPLAELVKIDPQHVGVGLYQHDMRPKYMKETLEAVIESCVNTVGVDVNTASVPLLRHVSGLNQLVARELVEFRRNNGPFQSREQLRQVPQMGESRFTQSAGFLKIRDGTDPLDNTWVHPESYPIARAILAELNFTPEDLKNAEKLAELREKLRTLNPEAIANIHKVGGATIRDIFEALARPGRDVREDRPQPIFRKGVLKLEDLTPGMELRGEILNVVDFGAFVDIGLKDSGLVHISQMANRFIKSPYDVVGVGDVVTVYVTTIDLDRKRVSLSMVAPGTERARPEPRGAVEPREPREPRRGPTQGGGPRPQGPRSQGGPRQGPPAADGERPPQGAGPRGGFTPRPGGTRPQPGGRGPGGPGGQGGWRGPRPQPGSGASPEGAVPQQPVPPPRPTKPKTVPKLSTEQKTGKAALNTFAELAAFFSPPPPPADTSDDQKKKQNPEQGDSTAPASE